MRINSKFSFILFDKHLSNIKSRYTDHEIGNEVENKKIFLYLNMTHNQRKIEVIKLVLKNISTLFIKPSWSYL